MYEWLVEIQSTSPHMIKALIAGTLVSTVCGVVGCFIVLRRTSFMADALAHSMLAGVVCGYLIMKVAFGVSSSPSAMIIGSLIAGIVTVTLVEFVSRNSRIKEDAVIGIMYTGIFAFGGVMLSMFSQYVHVDLGHIITGNVLAVADSDLWMMGAVAAGVFLVIILFFRHLQLVSFDPVMAASIGVPVVMLDYVLTTCTSLVVVSGVNIVGIILVVGLLIIPASTAYMLCDRLSRMLWLSAFFGFLSFVIGYFIAEAINVAPGSMVVFVSATQFMIVFAIAPKYGLVADWLRKMRAVPQSLVEDVLGCVLKAPGLKVSEQVILQHVSGSTMRIRQAIRSLERQELLVVDEGTVSLTDDGRREAKKLLRAHRLWETYLAAMGTPENELHDRAHHLEHVHDEDAVDYLDDKLGHPTKDPHGKEIPEDFVHLTPGAVVKASLLREGRQAEVVSIKGSPSSADQIKIGMTIVAGPRQDNDATWTFVLPNGKEVHMDHHDADAIQVQLESH